MSTPAEPNRDPSRRRKLLEKAKLPMLSGLATAMVVVGLLAVTAILVPVLFGQPTWIEAEIVLAMWWLIWIGVLTYLLYHGHQVSHDHELHKPRSWWPAFKNLDFDFLDLSSVGNADGCAIALLILIALPIVIVLLWFVVEVAIPLVIFFMYLLVRGMLARVANDVHECEGRLDRAILWAATWATIYTAPLGLVVWFVHWMMEKGGA